MIKNSAAAHISIISDDVLLKKIDGLVEYITTFLCRKSSHERLRQDLTNPTLLGGTKFWFQIDPKTTGIVLCYDKHPSEWNINGIMDDIRDMEHIFFVEEGVIFWAG